MLNFNDMNAVLKSKENEHKEDIRFLEHLVSFEKIINDLLSHKSKLDLGYATEHLNISVEAMNKVYEQFQKELANIQYKTDQLVKKLTFEDDLSEHLAKAIICGLFTAVTGVDHYDKYKTIDKSEGYTLPKRYMEKLKAIKATNYLHSGKYTVKYLNDSLERQMNDILLSDKKKKEFAAEKNLNKLQKAIHDARNVLSVYMWISKDIERVYKLNHQKIYPPPRKGSGSKFNSERSDHTHMLNGPMKVTGMP